MSRPTHQVLIVDDTSTYRMILSKVVERLAGLTPCGSAPNGAAAMDKLAELAKNKAREGSDHKPVELVLLDVEMPIMDGMQTLRAIHDRYPNLAVVMLSANNYKSADLTIRALEIGAMDFIVKPEFDSAEENFLALEKRLRRIVDSLDRKPQAVLTESVIRQPQPTRKTIKPAETPLPSKTSPPKKPEQKVLNPSQRTFDIICIGVSTGGPNALVELLSNMPAKVGVPIVIVQHMPPVFTASLAKRLDQQSPLRVKEAEHNEKLENDTVYIAPGDYHMTLASVGTQLKIMLNQDAPENSCRPAVDVLFRSVARIYGRKALSVIMTGMGYDGAEGVRAIRQAGGYCVTQTEQTCVVYGMPRRVDELGLSDEQVPLNQIANRLMQIIGTSRQLLKGACV